METQSLAVFAEKLQNVNSQGDTYKDRQIKFALVSTSLFFSSLVEGPDKDKKPKSTDISAAQLSGFLRAFNQIAGEEGHLTIVENPQQLDRLKSKLGLMRRYANSGLNAWKLNAADYQNIFLVATNYINTSPKLEWIVLEE